ncbi:hypothetical protein AMAG_02691 [Allomyces macrogynus ATCC 38327]|uniref:HMG box domain-containing protein n=1 Tax=Allomyces macrogynus (strain ATCC 38327) TaxID=578462 RepID=A0A0L0S2X7_ALLM3|nr:hypothetical protein AMAG_02691 [Allomyces macrogynus ATCC 38327]|eukprot:KNE56922.1 hypothetical protein AMAG_02691 [Allomyces macrogynus ATCC 38327]
MFRTLIAHTSRLAAAQPIVVPAAQLPRFAAPVLPRFAAVTARSKSTGVTPAPDAPKKPKTAYQIYMTDQLTNHRPAEYNAREWMSVAGTRWKTLDSTEKAPFEAKAAQLKEQYARDLAAYESTYTEAEITAQKLAAEKAKEEKLEKKLKRQAKADKVKHPLNAWQLFMMEYRSTLSDVQKKKGMAQVAKLAAAEWKTMDENARLPYTDKAAELKAAFEAEHGARQ